MAGEHLVYVGAQEMLIFFCFLESSKENLEVSFNTSREVGRFQQGKNTAFYLIKYWNTWTRYLSSLSQGWIDKFLNRYCCFVLFLFFSLSPTAHVQVGIWISYWHLKFNTSKMKHNLFQHDFFSRKFSMTLHGTNSLSVMYYIQILLKIDSQCLLSIEWWMGGVPVVINNPLGKIWN